jgi:tRNA (cytidine32/uridine32-2'-O)-methyltransferase
MNTSNEFTRNMLTRLVLVGTSHPGNIGAVARAMKNMGLLELYLVNPKIFPHADATARAAGADDVLQTAKVVASLAEAVGDCHLVIGTSARSRTLSWPLLDPRQAGELVAQESVQQHKVAVVFGRERSGLDNEELQQCHYHLQIPTNAKFSSLNLAAAVQIVAYEIKVAMDRIEQVPVAEISNIELPTAHELELFYQHLEQVLLDLEFLDKENPRQLMARLRRLFNRALPKKLEINILRGILKAVQENKR